MKICKITLLTFLVLQICGIGVIAQPLDREIRDFYESPRSALPVHELVRVSGNVILHLDDGRETTNLYVLRGNYGNTIYVRTTNALSPINARIEGLCGYLYDGVVYTDRRTGVRETGLYLVEAPCIEGAMTGNMVLVEISSRPENAVVFVNGELVGRTPFRHPMQRGEAHRVEFERMFFNNATVATFVPTQGSNTINGRLTPSYLLYVLVFGLIVFISGLVYYWMNRGPVPVPQPLPVTPPSPPPSPTSFPGTGYDPSKTVKMDSPTVINLKGRFKVLEGTGKLANTPELAFGVPVNQKDNVTITIGRASSNKPNHVKVDDPTVSRFQAEILYRNNVYHLVNKAPETSNPTIVNGSQMILNQVHQLAEGDIVEVGEQKLQFYIRQ